MMTTLRRVVAPAAALALLSVLAACGKPAGEGAAGVPAAKPAGTLHLYTWADYVKPELVTRFEQENNCRVVIDTFNSNEAMYPKLKAGATGYDLITPSSHMVTILAGEGLLQPIDHAKVPNIRHVDPEYLKLALDPQMKFSVPYLGVR